MKWKHYSWSGHHYDRKQDNAAIAFICLIIVILIGIVTLLAHWLNF